MKIGGLQKLSLIDYPGKTAAVIFTQGCDMFCPYCHNPQLVYPHLFEPPVKEDEVFAFLKKRQSLLQGVVITGGEPAAHNDLADFIRRIKDFDFSIKLDTNGSRPQVLLNLIKENLIDFIAMDVKAPLNKYSFFFKGYAGNIAESVEIVKSSGLPHHFRTTFDRDILDETDLQTIKELCRPSPHLLQECRKAAAM